MELLVINIKNPNLFILGAPKCGTTSLYTYLREHPNIFFSHIKGPHYFATDFENYRSVKTKVDYANLFSEANAQHSIIGEASVLYLYSENAIKGIYNDNPNAKLIIMLRNPIEVVQSWHAQMLWS